jgi:hypothetical protein
MSRLQILLFGPDSSSFLDHSYGYEPANELKSVLKHPNFRFGPYSPTDSKESVAEIVSWCGSFVRYEYSLPWAWQQPR